MLESGSLPSAVMYKLGISSRTVRDLKSQGAALLEEAEKKTPHNLFNPKVPLRREGQSMTERYEEGGGSLRRTREIVQNSGNTNCYQRACSSYS